MTPNILRDLLWPLAGGIVCTILAALWAMARDDRVMLGLLAGVLIFQGYILLVAALTHEEAEDKLNGTWRD